MKKTLAAAATALMFSASASANENQNNPENVIFKPQLLDLTARKGEQEYTTHAEGHFADNVDGHTIEYGNADNSTTNTYSNTYIHRKEDGRPSYTLEFEQLLKGASREYAGNETGTTAYADLYPNGRSANEPIFDDVRTSSVVATLSTDHGPMVEVLGARDMRSGFARASNLLHVDAFIHEMELSFLRNGELVERAICEADTYNPTKAPLEYDPGMRTADKITCSWSGPSLD